MRGSFCLEEGKARFMTLSEILSPPLWEQHLGDILRGEAGSVAGSQQPSCDPETLKTTIINNIPHFLYTKLLQRWLRYHTCLYRIEKKITWAWWKSLPNHCLTSWNKKKGEQPPNYSFLFFSFSSQCSCLLTRWK